ncbi:MAG TPA: hypothetical protein VGM77_02855 [Gemmatimonadales bacterium]
MRCNLLVAASTLIAASPDTAVRAIPARAYCARVHPLDLRHAAYGQPGDVYFAVEFPSPGGGVAMLINRVSGTTSLRTMTELRPGSGSVRCTANWDAAEMGLTPTRAADTLGRNRIASPTSWTISSAGQPVVDSASIAGVIAQFYLGREQPFVSGPGPAPFRIDTSTNAWNRLVARAIRQQRPTALPPLADSVAYYTNAESIEHLVVDLDTVSLTLKHSHCSERHTSRFTAGFTSSRYYMTRATPWLRESPDAAIMVAEGDCTPYQRPG